MNNGALFFFFFFGVLVIKVWSLGKNWELFFCCDLFCFIVNVWFFGVLFFMCSVLEYGFNCVHCFSEFWSLYVCIFEICPFLLVVKAWILRGILDFVLRILSFRVFVFCFEIWCCLCAGGSPREWWWYGIQLVWLGASFYYLQF